MLLPAWKPSLPPAVAVVVVVEEEGEEAGER